jgi:hypothetical protein
MSGGETSSNQSKFSTKPLESQLDVWGVIRGVFEQAARDPLAFIDREKEAELDSNRVD